MSELLRPGPARRWAVDAAIAVAVTAFAVGCTYAAGSWHPHAGPAGPATYAALAVGGLSLAGRRRFPVAVLAVTLGSALWAGAGSQTNLAWLSLIVAFFTAVLARRRTPRSRPCSPATSPRSGRPGGSAPRATPPWDSRSGWPSPCSSC